MSLRVHERRNTNQGEFDLSFLAKLYTDELLLSINVV